MGRQLLFYFCVVMGLAACAASPGGSESADLAFWFKCPSRADAMLESQFVAFLLQHGFESLNLGAIQRRHGINVFDLNITAIDQSHRIISIVAFPNTPGKQAVALYSEPPTRHDSRLEESLLNFASIGVACINSQITRGQNDSSVRKLHAHEVQRIKGLFKEAKVLGERGA